MLHFGFTKLVVADLEKCAAFYSEVFGLTEQGRVTDDIDGRRIDEIMYEATAPGGASFVLLHFPDLPQPGADGVIAGFITDDVAGVVQRTVAAGGSVIEDVRARPEHGVKVAFVADVEGRLIEVVELLA
ncbi:MAG: VOC family protein [Acidimicrobiales bacterium]|nr:VOC family protein [Acidimicrobiales bacterium]